MALSPGARLGHYQYRGGAGSNSGPMFDVSADGDRLLMIRETVGAPRTEIVIVEHWQEELTRLVPSN